MSCHVGGKGRVPGALLEVDSTAFLALQMGMPARLAGAIAFATTV